MHVSYVTIGRLRYIDPLHESLLIVRNFVFYHIMLYRHISLYMPLCRV